MNTIELARARGLYNAQFEKAVEHVVKMLDGTDGTRWNDTNPMYQGICGWGGVMSPLNRPAFVAKFGEAFTKEVEDKARETLAERAAFWENSKAKGYEAMADNAESNDPASYEVGGYVWGVQDGLKCDHQNFRHCIRHYVEYKEDKDVKEPRLCVITRIEDVEDIERDAETILKGWKAQGREGGTGSDDVPEEAFGKYGEGWSQLTDEQKRTFYTLTVLVRDKQGRFFLIDPEGHEYPRYVLLPKNWEKMYEGLVAEIAAEIKAEKEAEAKAKAEKEAADKAAYDARCAKWEGLMDPIPEGLDEYDREFRKIGKRNVLKMAKAGFPWVRFSVSYDGGWGTGYVLRWKNGPTVEEVKKAGDYGLFMPWWDTFDGMTDCADSESAQFTEFSDKFGGVGNGVKFEREECEKDQNGDPNAEKPPKPPRETAEKETESGETVEEVTVSENVAKGGLEIRFPSMPSLEVREYMKLNGWRWSRVARVWWHKASEEARATAAKVVEMCRKIGSGAAA